MEGGREGQKKALTPQPRWSCTLPRSSWECSLPSWSPDCEPATSLHPAVRERVWWDASGGGRQHTRSQYDLDISFPALGWLSLTCALIISSFSPFLNVRSSLVRCS